MLIKSFIVSLLTVVALLPTQNAFADKVTGYFWIQNGCWARHTDGTFTSVSARSCPTKVTQRMKDAAFGPIDETGELLFFGVVLPAVAGGPYLDHRAKRADYSRPTKDTSQEIHLERLLPPLLRSRQ